MTRESALHLHELPLNRSAHIVAVEWDMLGERDARRLRELGFDEGVTVEALHRAPFGGDPIACRIGRMTIALRRAQARAVRVELGRAG